MSNTESTPEKRVFSDSHESLVELFELHPQGTVFVCPVCDCELTVVLTKDEAKEKQIHPGVYCPTDPEHVYQMFNLSGDRKE